MHKHMTQTDILGMLDNMFMKYHSDSEYRDVIDEIFTNWMRGEAVDIPLEKWREFIIGADMLNEDIKSIISEIRIANLEKTGGILEITSRAKAPYGTGKTQFAKLLRHELERNFGGRRAYMIIASESSKDIAEKLENI